MRTRRFTIGVALALVAGVGADHNVCGHRRIVASGIQDGDRHRHRQPAGPLVQPARQRGPHRRRQGASASRRGSMRPSRKRERIPNMLAASSGRLQHDLRRRLPELQRNQCRRAEVQEAPVRRHRRRLRCCSRASQQNAAGVVFAEQEAGYLVGYLAGARDEEAGRHADHQRGRRATPCRRSCSYISGYIQGAKKANPKIKVLDQLRERPHLLRPGEVQGDGARPDPAGHAGRSSRSPAAVASARSRRRRRRGSGASASTPTSSISARS